MSVLALGFRFKSLSLYDMHQKKFHYHFLDNIPSINITDCTSSTDHEKRVVHATSSLSVNDILFVHKFLVSLLSINKLTTQNCHCAIFYPSYFVFQNLQTAMRIILVMNMRPLLLG